MSYIPGMTTPDAGNGKDWQTPGIEPITDANSMSDQMAPVRNGSQSNLA
jgi:hypothetical protein